MADKDQEEFSFMKEKIKRKPVNKRKLVQKLGFNVLLAVIFGFVACLVFTCMRPVIERWLYKDEEPRVSLPQYEEMEDTQIDTEEQTPEETETPVEGAEFSVDFSEMMPADYQILQNKLYAIGTQANHSIVTVTGVKNDTDWFNTPYERQGQSSGVVVADNGTELLIMTEKRIIEDVSTIHVTFVNNMTTDATLKKYDGNTGIAILSVPLNEIDEGTMNRIEIAQLGNALAESQGSVVLAVGSPLGTTYSILMGNITSANNSISAYDGNYGIFTTDIVGSSDGSGVLLNLDGDIIGIIMQDYSTGEANTLTAVSVSQVKDILEKLMNNQDVPYLGLKVSTVTKDIQEEYEIPQGVYVKDVAFDSPALEAGLQSGDVITKINGEPVETAQAYRNAIMSHSVGDTIRISVMRQGAEGYSAVSCRATIGVL